MRKKKEPECTEKEEISPRQRGNFVVVVHLGQGYILSL